MSHLNIIFICLSTSFIVQNVKKKKPFRVNPKLWECIIFRPKIACFPWKRIFFRKPISKTCCFRSCLSICTKFRCQSINEILSIKENWNLIGQEPRTLLSMTWEADISYTFQGFPNSGKGWGVGGSGWGLEILQREFFYHVVSTWGGVILTIHFSKLKTAFCKYWTSIKIKISMTSVSKNSMKLKQK